MISESKRYINVAAMMDSKVRYVSDSTSCMAQKSSVTPMVMASDVFFMLLRNSLPKGRDDLAEGQGQDDFAQCLGEAQAR